MNIDTGYLYFAAFFLGMCWVCWWVFAFGDTIFGGS